MVDDADGEEDDSTGGASTALSVRPVDTKRLVFARSLADAAPGEMVVVDSRGQAMTRRQVTKAKVVAWATFATSGVCVGVAWGALFHSPAVGVIAGAAFAALWLPRLRFWPAFRAAIAYLAASRWEEAHARLLLLEQRRPPIAHRRAVQVMLASAESLLGQSQQALDRLERLQRDDALWRGITRVARCQVASMRAGAFTTLDRLDDARRAREELVGAVAAATGRSARPRGDYLDMLLQATDLTIASAADTPDALPDDATLHAWARAALGRTRFGEMLVSLAWAFHRRGDDDMAQHLLAEAPSRITRWSLDKTSPRLHAWATTTAATWNIDLPTVR